MNFDQAAQVVDKLEAKPFNTNPQTDISLEVSIKVLDWSLNVQEAYALWESLNQIFAKPIPKIS